MSGRLERVRQVLAELGAVGGISAQALAEVAGLDRSNASRELNRLVLTGEARKVPGKPVRFLPVTADRPMVDPPVVRRAPLPVVATPTPDPRPAERQPLDGLLGAAGSLKGAVALAKAAILYPGGGLHTLILGQTGVGKSLFAEEMYRFATANGVLPAQAPFVIFNCADYASNPQLLLSQLFGAVKGAYTGAAADRTGVVEQAAGGMLFLDEVHRLPPEGQEMLFLLLDRGQLRRLGDSQLRSVQVRVVSATTEDPESSLLGTFLRRIPMIIRLPSLADRPASERLDLILHHFQAEADRVGIPMELSARALSRLIQYTPRGNVGQLKAEIQLASARAFLEEALSPTGLVRVEEHSLPLPEVAPGRSPLVGTYRFTPGAAQLPTSHMSEAIYERIVRRVRELEAEGRAAESGAQISAEINAYFAGVTDVDPAWQQAVERQVGPQILSWAGEVLDLAHERLGLATPPRARVGLAMHIASTLERLRQSKPISYPRLRELKQKHPQEVAAAAAMAERLGKLAGVAIPPDETGFLASFLLGVGGRVAGRIGVLVICHGSQTARSLVETAREIEGDATRLASVDWPLGEPIEQLMDRAEAALRSLDTDQGALILVDMGPLVGVGDLLTARTHIPTRTVDMVSLPRLLEAVRQAAAIEITLDELARGVVEPSRAPDRAGPTPAEAPERRQLLQQMAGTLKGRMKMVDPARVVSAIGRALQQVEAELETTVELDLFAGLSMQLAYLVDELAAKRGDGPAPESRALPEGRVPSAIAKGLAIVEREFDVQVPASQMERMALTLGG